MKKIIIFIVTVVILGALAVGAYFFFNKDTEKDFSMWEEIEIGANKDEAIEKIYYRFGRDNCEKKDINDTQIIRTTTSDFMGFKGIEGRVMYIFDNAGKLTDISVIIEDEKENLEELKELFIDYFREEAKAAGTDALEESDTSADEYTYFFVVDDVVYTVSYQTWFLVACCDYNVFLGK